MIPLSPVRPGPRTRPGAPTPTQRTTRLAPVLLAIAACVAFLCGPAAWAAGGAPSVEGTTLRLATPKPGSIQGVTLDAWGRALGGVRVLVSPAGDDGTTAVLTRVLSDETGRFLLSGLAPGVYRVVAMKGGYTVFVGRVDTLLQSSIDLVLYPAGHHADPGAQPSDMSWALRLPQRDVLEDQRAAAPDDTTLAPAFSPAPVDMPFSIEFAHARDELGAADESIGYDLRVGGLFDLEGAGLLDVRVAHRSVGTSSASHDVADSVRALWRLESGSPQSDTRVGFEGHHADRQITEPGAGFAPAESVHERGRFFASRKRFLGDHEFEAGASLAFARGTQDFGDEAIDEREALALTAHAALDAAWRDRHRAVVRAAVHGIDAGTSGSSDDVLTIANVLPRHGLTGAVSEIAELGLENTYRHSDALAFRGRVQTMHAWSETSPWSTSATAGVTWELSPVVRVVADAGVASSGAIGEEGIWSVTLEHAGDVFSASVSREHVSGVPFATADGAADAMGAFDEGGASGSSLLLWSHDSVRDRWTAQARVAPQGGWPAFTLRGSTGRIDGDVAAYLPGDAPIAPIARGGEADETSVSLEVSSSRFGTTIEVTWESVEDRDGAFTLLSGARTWERRGVTIRQQLGLREWWGARCFLMLGYGEHETSPTNASGAAPDSAPARLALLQQRRVSGGVAVAF